MYPLALEKQNELTFSRTFLGYAEHVNRKVLSAAKSTAHELSATVRQDSVQELIDLMRQIQSETGPRLGKELLEKRLRSNYSLIEKSAREIAEKAWRNVYSATQSGAGQRGSPSRPNLPWAGGTALGVLPVVNPFNMRNPEVEAELRDRVRAGVEMLNNLAGEHTQNIFRIAYDGVRDGETLKDIEKKIKASTGARDSTARFWARDQVGDINAQMSRIRQTEAGFPGYIWMTMKDSKVRESHSENGGKYFTWTEGASNLKKPGARHAGEDYRDRCSPKPAMGPPDEQAQTQANQETKSAIEADKQRVLRIREEQARRLEAMRKKPVHPGDPSQVKHSAPANNPSPVQPEQNGISPIDSVWERHNLGDQKNWRSDTISDLLKSLKKDHGLPASDFIESIKGAKKTGLLSEESIAAVIQDVIDILPEEVLKSNKFPKINFGVAGSRIVGGKAFGSYGAGEILLNQSMIKTVADLRTTIYHELMHWVHMHGTGERVLSFRKSISEFYRIRTVRDTPKILKTGRSVYGMLREDKWWTAYAGVERKHYASWDEARELAPTHFQLLADPDGLLLEMMFNKNRDFLPEAILKILEILR